MRILLLAPNGGASLSQGGGTRVLLQHAEILRERGHEVALAGFHSLPADQLAAVHGTDMPFRVPIFTHTQGGALGLAAGLPWKASAYNVLVLGAFRRWIERVISGFRPGAVWFHDDIPRAAIPALGSIPRLLYVHYPFGARDPNITPPLQYTRSRVERWNDRLLRSVEPVAPDPAGQAEVVWVNSSVTARALRKLWGAPCQVVPPAFGAPPSGRAAGFSKTILAVGTFSRGKNLEALVIAFAHAGLEGWELHLLGHSRDAQYAHRITRHARRLRRQGIEVRVTTNAHRPDLEREFRSAQVFVHPAEFEPFGIALVEAMARGAAPIAFAGEFSGPWTDILDSGRHGVGFREPEDLTSALTKLSDSAVQAHWSGRAIQRAAHYSPDSMRAAFDGLHESGILTRS
jgi:glycosyltransferase involved in cell wall biosynthesis